MNGKCWSCPEPIGDIRCRPLEKLLAAATTSCKFRRNGCYKAVRLTERQSHEDTCPRAPYDCPFDGCTYSGLRLSHHVAQDHGGGPDGFAAIGGLLGTAVTVHKDAPFRVLLLQGDRESVFLLLNGRDLLQGRSLSLLCLGPRPEGGVELEYAMEVGGNAAAPGAELSLSASGTVPCARRLEGFQAKGFLFVPDAYWGSSGTVSVRVRV
jgi:E3 ubiquitin-protein ligase SIAH1